MRLAHAETQCLDNPGLAAGTTTTLSHANAHDYTIDGKLYNKAAASNEATPTTDINTGVAFTGIGVNKGGVFIVGRNAAGDLKCAQGEIVDLNASGNMVNAPNFPAIPQNFCPTGVILVRVGPTGSTWTFGASNFAGPPTGVSFTFINGMPDRLQAA